MVAGQRQCPRLMRLGAGGHELLASCSLLVLRCRESIWRLYPVAVSSWLPFFEPRSIDGRAASMGSTFRFNSYILCTMCSYVAMNRFVTAAACHLINKFYFRGPSSAPMKRLFTTQSQFGCAYRHPQIFAGLDFPGNTHKQTGIHHFPL
jgi:hypothetical protein